MNAMLRTKDLAEELQLSDDTIRYACGSGELKAYKFGQEWRIKREDADSWIESHYASSESERKPVRLARADADQTRFGQVARSMDRRDGQAQAETVRLKEAS